MKTKLISVMVAAGLFLLLVPPRRKTVTEQVQRSPDTFTPPLFNTTTLH